MWSMSDIGLNSLRCVTRVHVLNSIASLKFRFHSRQNLKSYKWFQAATGLFSYFFYGIKVVWFLIWLFRHCWVSLQCILYGSDFRTTYWSGPNHNLIENISFCVFAFHSATQTTQLSYLCWKAQIWAILPAVFSYPLPVEVGGVAQWLVSGTVEDGEDGLASVNAFIFSIALWKGEKRETFIVLTRKIPQTFLISSTISRNWVRVGVWWHQSWLNTNIVPLFYYPKPPVKGFFRQYHVKKWFV